MFKKNIKDFVLYNWSYLNNRKCLSFKKYFKLKEK